MSIIEIIGGSLAILGAFIFLAAGIGLYRFHDPYMRNSAVGTASGLGISLVTIGSAMVHPKEGTVAIALVAVILQLITSSVAAMLVARAAVNSSHEFSPETDTTALGELPEAGQAEDASDGVDDSSTRAPSEDTSRT